MFGHSRIPQTMRIMVVLSLLISAMAFPAAVYAGGILTVNTNVDEISFNGFCSLREAITNANNDAQTYADCPTGSGADFIVFPASPITIILGSQLPMVTSVLTINGKGSIVQANVSALASNYRVFYVGATGNLTLNNLTVQNGRCNGLCDGGIFYNSAGGGILNQGTLTLNTSLIKGNSAASGGGIDSLAGTISIFRSTFLNNTAVNDGGGLNKVSGTAIIGNTTFSGNSANYGGGFANNGGGASIYNSTFSGNNANTDGGALSTWNAATTAIYNTIMANSTTSEDCWNGLGDGILSGNTSNHNLIETTAAGAASCSSVMASTADPLLGSLTGFPAYFPLLAGSPAINAGSDFVCATVPVGNSSENGFSRPKESHCDIGAYEFLQTFSDVPNTHPYWLDIETLYANGLTAGCSAVPLNFCPDQIMDRAQSSVFVLRGNFGTGYIPPVAPWNTFADDWSAGTWAEKWAEGMYAAGLTAGCATGPLRYCPWDQTPRVQAVVFGLRLKYGNAYAPPVASGTMFADMTNSAYFGTKWAEQAYLDGLLPNCGIEIGSGKPYFCPNDLVSRGLGAYMIVRAKNLTMP
jgi:CSLREA domain-containing protein